jgi:hypothetical protein
MIAMRAARPATLAGGAAKPACPVSFYQDMAV